MKETTTRTVVYQTDGDSANFVASIRAAIEAAQSRVGPEDDDDLEYRFTLSGPYGYRLDARFTREGICERYMARKTGYDGDFTMEGRGETPEVLSLLERFFRAGTPSKAENEQRYA